MSNENGEFEDRPLGREPSIDAPEFAGGGDGGVSMGEFVIPGFENESDK